MKRPIDIPTRETANFIASYLAPSAELLEVGAGHGHVAMELSRRGHRVLGLESNQETVVHARQRGAPVMRATWPEYSGTSVDAVAFTRSLHHIGPLAKAVGKARELVRAAGTLLVEDFAFDAVNKATFEWFREILDSRFVPALLDQQAGQFVADLLRSNDPLATWREHHDHEIHSIATMTRAIEAAFDVCETRLLPYLYRYTVPLLPETSEAAAFVQDVLQEETRLGERGEILLIGRRLVASRYQPQTG